MSYKSKDYRRAAGWGACLALIGATASLAWAAEPEGRALPRPASLLLAQAPVPDAAGVPPPPRFEIRRFRVDGNTLLTPETVNRLVAPYTGEQKDFADVQRALESLQQAYQEIGYVGVLVTLPEQELDRGEVVFRVIEARIGKVLIEGNENYSAANIRRSIPAIREHEPPNAIEIHRSVRLANESPSKQSAVLLRAGESEGVSDAVIRVADIDPQRWSVTLDNTGNDSTGKLRLGFAYQHANLFDRDHVLTAQYITSPENFKNVTVFGLGYRIPLYGSGNSVDLVAGYSNVDSGTVQNLFVVSGAGAIYGVRYNQNLTRWGELEHRLTYGLDYRAYQNQVNPTDSATNLVPDITVHPLSITYSGNLRQADRELNFFASLVRNWSGGNDGRDENFSALGARYPYGKAGYRLLRLGGSLTGSFASDWQYRVRADAQYTDDALVAAEQFAIGGADNVRGFNERYTANDSGYRTNWEIYTPDLARHVGLNEGRLRLLGFYDTGVVHRNHVQPGELYAASLDSVGIGMRFSYRTSLTARMDLAHVLHDGSQNGLGADGARNRKKVHFSLAWVF